MNAYWSRIKSIVTKDADKYLYAPIPPERTDLAMPADPLKPYRSYLRLWVSEMFLTKSRNWFTDFYPATHASVMLKFGEYGPVIFSHVNQAPQQVLANGVLLNYAVTDLLPFNGGLVEIEASLLAMKGRNYLNSAIKMLQDFSSLVSAPVGMALNVAEKISAGMESLLNADDENKVHLPFHQTFTSANGGATALKPGYIAVIRATADQIDINHLAVKDSQLFVEQPRQAPQPFRKHDYFLLYLEGRAERDDWRIKSIEEAYDKAIAAWYEGDLEKAETYKRTAIAMALTAPELAHHDRRRAAQALQKEFDDLAGGGYGAAGDEIPTLTEVIQRRAISIDEAVALGEATFAEFFGD